MRITLFFFLPPPSQLFDFDVEVQPVLEVLVGKTVEQSLLEVMEEEEMACLRAQQRSFQELRNAELAEVQRLEEQERRRREEKVRVDRTERTYGRYRGYFSFDSLDRFLFLLYFHYYPYLSFSFVSVSSLGFLVISISVLFERSRSTESTVSVEL